MISARRWSWRTDLTTGTAGSGKPVSRSRAVAPLLAKGSEPVKRLGEAAAVFSEIMAAPDKGIPQDLLEKAAAEFESMLLTNLWKSMKSSFASSDDESSDPAHDVLADMGIQAMSSAVAKTGGLGLGKLILKHLEPLLARPANASGAQPGKASAIPADTFIEGR